MKSQYAATVVAKPPTTRTPAAARCRMQLAERRVLAADARNVAHRTLAEIDDDGAAV